MPSTEEPDKEDVAMRRPSEGDARDIWRMVRESGVLDENSAYLYLLLCRDFRDTCLVAEGEAGLAGFVTAYRMPSDPSVLFIWQIGVAPTMRRRGLASRMLIELLQRDPSRGTRYIEATVSPSNRASRRLFDALARQLGVALEEVTGFAADDFPAGGHEAEPRLRLGPMRERNARRADDAC